jgi:hypothetical protein
MVPFINSIPTSRSAHTNFDPVTLTMSLAGANDPDHDLAYTF